MLDIIGWATWIICVMTLGPLTGTLVYIGLGMLIQCIFFGACRLLASIIDFCVRVIEK